MIHFALAWRIFRALRTLLLAPELLLQRAGSRNLGPWASKLFGARETGACTRSSASDRGTGARISDRSLSVSLSPYDLKLKASCKCTCVYAIHT